MVGELPLTRYCAVLCCAVPLWFGIYLAEYCVVRCLWGKLLEAEGVRTWQRWSGLCLPCAILPRQFGTVEWFDEPRRCGSETAAIRLRRSISECVDRQIKLMPGESFINVIGILSFLEYSGRQAGWTPPAGGDVVWLLVRLSEEWVSGWMDGMCNAGESLNNSMNVSNAGAEVDP